MRQAVGYWRLVTSILALSLTASACTSTASVADDQKTPASTTSTTLAPVTTTTTASAETVSTTTLPNPTTTTTTSPLISLDGTECTSSIPEDWSGGAFEIENKNTMTMAVVMGTYHDGYGHADLVAYGRDITPRPDFIDALEIYEVGPQTTRVVSFDYGPGQYFTTCLDSTSTMIVLDDVTVRN